MLKRKNCQVNGRSVDKMGDNRSVSKRSKSLPSISMKTKSFQGHFEDAPSNTVDAQLRELDTVRVRQFSTTIKGLVKMSDIRKNDRRQSDHSITSYRRNSYFIISDVCDDHGRRNSENVNNVSRRNSAFISSRCTPVRQSPSPTACNIMANEYTLLNQNIFPECSKELVHYECPPEYHVLVVGSAGVGKSAIINQFTTSEFLGAADVHTDSNEQRTSVTVILNNEESVIHLIEENSMTTFHEITDYHVDAYMIVYSCADRNTFQSASIELKRLSEENGSCKTVMIVANKVDLARKRLVSYEEGRILAHSCNFKYIETSAALNHNIDELLAGILSQIRKKQGDQCVTDSAISTIKPRQPKGLTDAFKTAFKGVFCKKPKIHSCEKLYDE